MAIQITLMLVQASIATGAWAVRRRRTNYEEAKRDPNDDQYKPLRGLITLNRSFFYT